MSSVDVLVPCYRYGHFLRECVESVLSQSLRDVRVLIIDDASPDNTAEVATELARADSRVTFLRHTTNKGHIATYNEGIEWASADYMLLLSADDYLLPDCLLRSSDLMDAYPNVGFAFGKAIDLRGRVLETDSLANKAVESVVGGNPACILNGEEFFSLIASFKSTNIVRTPTAVVRTALQRQVGGYRPDLPHTGDLEMWLRLAAHSSVAVLAEYQAIYRLHGNNMQETYYRAKCLPDLKQRRAAVDVVFNIYSNRLAHCQHVYRSLMNSLASEAVRYASEAFDADDLELTQQLRRFAASADRKITRDPAWLMLKIKSLVGRRISRVVVPRLRQLRRSYFSY